MTELKTVITAQGLTDSFHIITRFMLLHLAEDTLPTWLKENVNVAFHQAFTVYRNDLRRQKYHVRIQRGRRGSGPPPPGKLQKYRVP